MKQDNDPKFKHKKSVTAGKWWLGAPLVILLAIYAIGLAIDVLL